MDPELRWRDLPAAPALELAIESAEEEASRSAIRDEVARIQALPSEPDRKRERAILRDMRKRWSERFARACATMIASELRGHAVVRNRYEVLPSADGSGQETFTPLGYKKGKKIDVVVSGALVGLQIGVSLKGLNFADDSSGNHDKNLTGRLYEVRDEVSTVHDYLPRAFMATIFFMPVAACLDKVAAPSSFAHVVEELRARTGRLDPSVAAHAWRGDFASVGLYVPGDPQDNDLGLSRGAVRFFPLLHENGDENLPPRRGRPPIATTIDLPGLVDRLVNSAIEGSAITTRFGPAEVDGAPSETNAQDPVAEERYDPDDDEDLDDTSLSPDI